MAEGDFFGDRQSGAASAADVRAFMLRWMGLPEVERIRNVRHYWKPLTPEQKDAALKEAFPDGRDYHQDDDDAGPSRPRGLPDVDALNRLIQEIRTSDNPQAIVKRVLDEAKRQEGGSGDKAT